MKPEEEVEIILYNWFKKSSIIKRILFNRKNILDCPVFKTTGLNRKPDFLLLIDRGFGEEYVALEIKTSNQSKNIHDAGKIIDYYINYITGKTIYYVDEEQVKISHFCIASDKSPEGHLFDNEKELFDNTMCDDNWRVANAKYGLEPKIEYSLTSSWIRNLWSQFKRLREQYNLKNGGPSMGVIISNFGDKNFTPHLMIMNYNSHLDKKKWGARWWQI